MRHHAKCCADQSNRYRDIVIFKLLGCWLPPSWISLDVKFVTDQTGQEGRTASPCQILLNRCRDIAIFQNGGGRQVGFLKLQSSNCGKHHKCCLLYTSPSPRDGLLSRMPSSA